MATPKLTKDTASKRAQEIFDAIRWSHELPDEREKSLTTILKTTLEEGISAGKKISKEITSGGLVAQWVALTISAIMFQHFVSLENSFWGIFWGIMALINAFGLISNFIKWYKLGG